MLLAHGVCALGVLVILGETVFREGFSCINTVSVVMQNDLVCPQTTCDSARQKSNLEQTISF